MNAGYAGRLAGINGRPMAAGEAAAALAAALAERVAAVAAKEAQLLVGSVWPRKLGNAPKELWDSGCTW